MALNKGWLHIERGETYAMQIMLAGVPPWTLTYNEAYLFKEDLPGKTHLAAMVNQQKRVVNCFELMFTTQADLETFMANIPILNLAGSMTLEIQTSATPTYLKLNGVATKMEVNCPDFKNVQPLALGGGTIYMIPQLVLEQTGAVV